MKIKNQFLVSILIFGIILAVLVGSVLVVQQQTNQWSNQETISQDIQTRSNNLAYISNDYFLYQDSSQLSLWQTEFSSLSTDLSKLNVSSPEQQTLLNNTKSDAQRLNDRWNDVASYLATAPRNESVRVLPAFQADWSRMTLQNQALIFDSQQLSQSLRSQVDQLNLTTLILIFSLLGLFAAYFITNYLLTYRNTLKSIAELQAGIAVIGSGNLDYPLKADKKDEIGEISQSFNQMTANLKTVTASRADLEKEIAERKKAEAEREITIEFLRIANQTVGTRDLIKQTVDFFQKQSGCEAVGIRIKDGEDYPYFETHGFPPEHVELENKLCARDETGYVIRDFKGDPVIECMCGNVICGRFDPSKEFFTEKGSFWANDTTRLLATTSDAERQAHTRNRCNGEGYESVALIALKVGNNRLGLLQLNDKRRNMFTLETIQIWERVADHLALALSKNLSDESLQKSEERWSTTLSSIGDSVIATDATGHITFMNAIAEKSTGWTLSDALGKPLKDVFQIINEETRQQVQSPVTEVLEKGVIVGLANHTILLRRDGSEVPLDDSGAPIKDQNGNVTGIVLVFHDISERKKAEEATQKQAELIDLSPDAIIVRRIDGTITFWSEGAEKLYGWTKDEAIGRNINELLQTDLPKSPIDIQNQLKKNGKWSGEVVHFCKDGSKLVVQSYWLAKFGSGGEIYEMLESNVDVTERIQMQLKFEESAVRLEEYANQMEALANQRAAQLKDAERLAAIGATAGMVGHDIRNPLQAITSDLYLAKTELETLPVSEQKNSAIESLDEIQKNIDYINKIVADLQDYARPLKPSAKGTDLENLCRDVFLKSNIPNNIKASFKAEKEAKQVMADPDLIRRIISNLVLNAIQAMPNGGELSVYAYRKEGGLVIEVKDTGEGIPDEVKGKLFTPMFTTKSKGQGFGLAVVKRVTEAMNGTVSFESEQGKGTTFIISLPPPQAAKR